MSTRLYNENVHYVAVVEDQQVVLGTKSNQPQLLLTVKLVGAANKKEDVDLKAGFADYPILAYNLQQGNFADVRLVDGYKPVTVGTVAIGVRKSDTELLGKINASLAKLKATTPAPTRGRVTKVESLVPKPLSRSPTPESLAETRSMTGPVAASTAAPALAAKPGSSRGTSSM